MQYIHHDFYYNFSASIKSGDFNVTSDLLANELSDYLVYDTDKIITALNKSGIEITNKATDEEVVDTIIKNLKSNDKLPNALAFIIAEGNDLINAKTPAIIKGPKGNPISINTKEKQLKVINDIADGVSNLKEEINKNSRDFKKSTMAQIVSKAGQKKQYDRVIWNKDKPGMSAGTLLFVSVILIGGVIAYIYYRQKKSIQAAIPNMILGEGATLNGGSQIPPMNNLPVTPSPTLEPLKVDPIQTTIQPVMANS